MKRRDLLKKAGLAAALAALYPGALFAGAKKIVLGLSRIDVPRRALIGTQVDRVFRDIAWTGSKFDRSAYPFRVDDRMGFVPYMEGRLTQDLVTYTDARVVGLGPAIAQKSDDGVFASDGLGNYPFEVDESKVSYDSALWSSDGTMVHLPDTHGFNMVAGAAFRTHWLSNFGLNLVIACMDLPDKADAARYLAEQGINCFGPCDRFGCDLVGQTFENATIIGSAPIRDSADGAVIGAQPVAIMTNEAIIVQTTDRGYPDQYCDTPYRYFKALQDHFGFGLALRPVEANVGETGKVVQAALEHKAQVIGVRVHNDEDAEPVRAWLGGYGTRRAILFHSAPYEPGYRLFHEFPKQTSFGDLTPQLTS